MKSIRPPFKIAKSLLSLQDVCIGEKYRPISFVVLVDVDGQKAAYNTLTGELLFIDESEYDILSCDTVVADEANADLIKNWFLVPIEHDDKKLRDELVDFGSLLKQSKKKKSYLILPTTGCNARCFYCFELGAKHLHMSEKIAKDTVDYILRTCDKKIAINWFGGEPLYNISAIDTIVKGLCDAGVEFESSMISNAYLFDDEVVQKAVNDWKLKKVQVTLDGTEEVYNRIKAYIYRDCVSPFKVVMDNIERLLKADITVSIRLNVSNENASNLIDLVDILGERFSKYPKFGVYSHMLFDLPDRNIIIKNDIEHQELVRNWIEVETKIERVGIGGKNYIPKEIKFNRCMADSSAAIMILPDGHIGKCEHYIDSRFVGDIYSGETDNETLAAFRERVVLDELCRGCKVYPSCIQLKPCPTHGSYICDETIRRHKEERLYKGVKNAVKAFLSKDNI